VIGRSKVNERLLDITSYRILLDVTNYENIFGNIENVDCKLGHQENFNVLHRR
jgi:hypothetical protein